MHVSILDQDWDDLRVYFWIHKCIFGINTCMFENGDGSHSPCSLSDGPANAIFANHSSSKSNAKIEVKARDRKVSTFEACEPRHRIILVATEPITAGAEIRFDYEAGKKVSATQS